MKRRWVLFLFWTALLASALAFSPPPQADDSQIQIDIRAGFNSYYRAGKWTPIHVTINNSGSDINGTLQVRTQDVGENADALYQTPLSVARNTPKTIPINISLESGKPDIVVELLDNNGRILKSVSHTLTQISNRDILYAVITESLQGNIDLTRHPLGLGRRYQVNWDTDDIPTQADALQSLDVIVFFDVRNDRLTSEQQNALEAWVHSGGHLIIHGGPGWQYAQNFLNPLLPSDLEGLEVIYSLAPLGQFLGYPDDKKLSTTNETGFVATRNTPRQDAEVLLSIDGLPIITRKGFGGGIVDYVAIDPLTAPLKDYAYTDRIWLNLTLSTNPRPSWNFGFQDWAAANNAVRILSNISLPSVIQMLAFLSIYIVLIGPINYLILYGIGRRELAWFSIPLLIVIFTVIAYFTGFSFRGNAASVNHLSVVQVWADSDIARVDGLVGIFSPRRTTYDISVDNNMTLRTIPGVKDTDTGIAQIPIIEDANYHVENLPVDAGIIASFATSGYTLAPHIDAEATWELNNSESPNLSGSVTNTEDFTLYDVVVLAKDGFFPIGTIESGETRNFNFSGDFRIYLQEPTWLALGNRGETSTANPYRSFTARPSRGRTNSYMNLPHIQTPYDCSVGGFNAMLVQVMYGQTFDCYARGGTADEISSRRRAFMLSAINNEFDYSGGRAGNVYVLGWTKESPFKVTLAGTSQRNQYETLYIFEIPTTFTTDPDSSFIVIPPGLLTWTTLSSSNFGLERSPYNLQLISGESAVYSFIPVNGLRQQSIQYIRFNIFVNSGSYRSIYITVWDWEQGDWVELELQSDTSQQPFYDLENPAPYLGPNNELRLQVQPSQNINEVFINSIEPVMYIQ